MLAVLRTNLPSRAFFRFHNNAFDHKYEGEELANALFAHTRMGYNFVVRKVDVAVSKVPNTVDIDVTVEQIGIAPFYYPLSLLLDCDDDLLEWPMAYRGVEQLIAKGDSKVYRFDAVPGTSKCLQSISLKLDSDNAYKDRPIKFAQGTTGMITLNIPVPPLTVSSTAAPIPRPVSSPIPLPIPLAAPPIPLPIPLASPMQMDYTLTRIENGIAIVVGPVWNGAVVDLSRVGRYLNLRTKVNPDDADIDVQFVFNGNTVLERTPPFRLLPRRDGQEIAAPYLGYAGQKSIQVTLLNAAGVALQSQTLTFQVVDAV
jgi:hypothetical protein